MTDLLARLEPADERESAELRDALAWAIARASAEAAHRSREAEELGRYGPAGSDAAREARIADVRRQADEHEARARALNAALARLEGSDWPAAELVDGITDDDSADAARDDEAFTTRRDAA